MSNQPYSVDAVSSGLTNALNQYLEAQYHIWDDDLLGERRRLLDGIGSTHQSPYLEATPAYATAGKYSELELPSPVREILTFASEIKNSGIYSPPYCHQAESLGAYFNEQQDLIVATGTGSGKTESFLMPILGNLAIEAARSSGTRTTKMHGMRALLLYPMNALVNDQVSRLRKLLGNDLLAQKLRSEFGRSVRFGMYTGRTAYPGKQTTAKDNSRLRQLIEALFNHLPVSTRELLKTEGKWPAKDMEAFVQNNFRSNANDCELFSRQEMQVTCPDILVTNYSMLEYMLLRPIERPIFEQTKAWLNENEQNFLTLVIDEAHMYRGAAGAEVAMLLRRLQARLEIPRNRVRYILTSASLGSSDDHKARIKQFAADLTGMSANGGKFSLITGTQETLTVAGEPTKKETAALASLTSDRIHEHSSNLGGAIGEFNKLMGALGQATVPANLSLSDFRDAIFAFLRTFPPAGLLTRLITGIPTKPDDLQAALKLTSPEGQHALDGLITLSTFGRRAIDGRVFLPIRLHLFFRGFGGLYACINPRCSERASTANKSILGRLFDNPRDSCPCGGRVFELFTHRDCGTAYLKGYFKDENADFVWHEKSTSISTSGRQLVGVEFLAEVDRNREVKHTSSQAWIHIYTGQIVRRRPTDSGDFLPVLQPPIDKTGTGHSFSSCPVCLRGWKQGQTKIMDLVTKGEAPFAHLIKTQVQLQPATRLASRLFPNAGRKSLIFSDGRQKAARLARDIPRETERDVFRQLIAMSVQALNELNVEAKLERNLFFAFIHVVASQNIVMFDGVHQEALNRIVGKYRKDYGDAGDIKEAIEQEAMPPGEQYWASLLRQIGPGPYTMPALTLAFVEPSAFAIGRIRQALPTIAENDLNALLNIWINGLLSRYAFNSHLTEGIRISAGGYGNASISRGFHKKETAFLRPTFPNLLEIESVFKEAMVNEDASGSIFLRPDRSKLTLAHERDWFRCRVCTAVSPFTLRDLCLNCGSNQIEKTSAVLSDYLRARKTFWRDPVVGVLAKTQAPFNLTVEEHTAQLNYKDVDEPSSTTEEFERRFRDITSPTELPVDVLSSTTTMEVGIDIGSLIAVALRNVPPMRQNYQQRAGRTGRRGAAVSTVITFAQNSPHDSHYFDHPAEIISGDPPLPAIDVRNPKIIARHVHAALIHSFFHERIVSTGGSNDIFSMLGSTWDFFNKPDQDFCLEQFTEWINEPEREELLFPALTEWLPAGVQLDVHQIAQEFLTALLTNTPRDPNRLAGDEKHLIEYLFSRGLLPAYAFPRDLCALQIERIGPLENGQTVKIIERPQQSLAVALTEYAPARLVVVNKKTYRIGSVTASSNSTVTKRALPLFDEMRHFYTCPECSFTQFLLPDVQPPKACPLCAADKAYAMNVIQPEVVYPDLKKEISELDDEQVITFASSAQFPFATQDEEFEWTTPFDGTRMTAAINQQLIMVNAGPSGADRPEGFWVCRECGKTRIDGTDSSPHAPDYYVEHFGGRQSTRCTGIFTNVFLGYAFATDVMLMRIQLDTPILTDITNRATRRPLDSALTSVAEAISLAAAHTLDIDPRELSVGHRFVSLNGKTFVDLYLFDTLAGGAGYAHMASTQILTVIADAEALLANCTCDVSCTKCLRHYGNRFKHGDLDRFLALDLIRYIRTRRPPVALALNEQRQALRRLSQMFSLDGWTIDDHGNSPLKAVKGVEQRSICAYPSLLDLSAATFSKTDVEHWISIFDLKRDLPGVFAAISSPLSVSA